MIFNNLHEKQMQISITTADIKGLKQRLKSGFFDDNKTLHDRCINTINNLSNALKTFKMAKVTRNAI